MRMINTILMDLIIKLQQCQNNSKTLLSAFMETHVTWYALMHSVENQGSSVNRVREIVRNAPCSMKVVKR